MPSRFEVVPDVTSDAGATLSGALRDALVHADDGAARVRVAFGGLLADASAVAEAAASAIADAAWRSRGRRRWPPASGEAGDVHEENAAYDVHDVHDTRATDGDDGWWHQARALLLLASLLWLLRELLVRATATRLVRAHGHAHVD